MAAPHARCSPVAGPPRPEIRAAGERVESLDVLINHAGISFSNDLSDRAALDRHLAVNLFGPWDLLDDDVAQRPDRVNLARDRGLLPAFRVRGETSPALPPSRRTSATCHLGNALWVEQGSAMCGAFPIPRRQAAETTTIARQNGTVS
jgi:NAD(P)-dependent dehydrogenase (short-subunit alcohol dehydrogenase family)